MKTTINWELWIGIVGLGIALIGAIPQIIDWCKVVQIKGKLLSQYGSFVTIAKNSQPQIVYVQKLSIFSRNNDFFPKDIRVFIKYPSINNEIEAKMMVWRTNGLEMDFNENGIAVNKTLKIDPKD